jgi:RNA polymerase sigma-70 factor (ECF subfamily)
MAELMDADDRSGGAGRGWGRSDMGPDVTFDELMRLVRDSDDAAETALFRRYVRRLNALVARRFAAGLRDRADVELVVLSAFKSFFLRHRRGELRVDDPDGLWSVLAMITLRKCADRLRYLRAARRDAGRDVEWPDDEVDSSSRPDPSPAPDEAACATEAVESLLQALSADDRPIVEHLLIGYTAEEISARLDCSERTVRRVRQRAKHLLRRLIDAEGIGAGRS